MQCVVNGGVFGHADQIPWLILDYVPDLLPNPLVLLKQPVMQFLALERSPASLGQPLARGTPGMAAAELEESFGQRSGERLDQEDVGNSHPCVEESPTPVATLKFVDGRLS